MIKFIVQNTSLTFRTDRNEAEQKSISSATALLISFLLDVDLVTDWVYFAAIANIKNTTEIPYWILIFQLVTCIFGSFAWSCNASDGRTFKWLAFMCKWIILRPLWIVHFVFFEIPEMIFGCCNVDLRNTWYGRHSDKVQNLVDAVEIRFNSYANLSSAGLMLLGVLFEDIPQVVMTILMEDAIGSENGYSESAKLNITLSTISIFYKLANAWDDQMNAMGDGDDQTKGCGDYVKVSETDSTKAV